MEAAGGPGPEKRVRWEEGLGHQKVGKEWALCPSLAPQADPRLSVPCSLYPVVPTNSRIMDKETEVDGFLFPKNVSGPRVYECPGVPRALC